MTDRHVAVRPHSVKAMASYVKTGSEVYQLLCGNTLAKRRAAMLELYGLVVRLEVQYYREAERLEEEEAEKLDELQREAHEWGARERRRLDRVERSEIRKRGYEQKDEAAAGGSDDERAGVDGKER